jgi:hypothetical protein
VCGVESEANCSIEQWVKLTGSVMGTQYDIIMWEVPKTWLTRRVGAAADSGFILRKI